MVCAIDTTAGNKEYNFEMGRTAKVRDVLERVRAMGVAQPMSPMMRGDEIDLNSELDLIGSSPITLELYPARGHERHTNGSDNSDDEQEVVSFNPRSPSKIDFHELADVRITICPSCRDLPPPRKRASRVAKVAKLAAPIVVFFVKVGTGSQAGKWAVVDQTEFRINEFDPVFEKKFEVTVGQIVRLGKMKDDETENTVLKFAVYNARECIKRKDLLGEATLTLRELQTKNRLELVLRNPENSIFTQRLQHKQAYLDLDISHTAEAAGLKPEHKRVSVANQQEANARMSTSTARPSMVDTVTAPLQCWLVQHKSKAKWEPMFCKLDRNRLLLFKLKPNQKTIKEKQQEPRFATYNFHLAGAKLLHIRYKTMLFKTDPWKSTENTNAERCYPDKACSDSNLVFGIITCRKNEQDVGETCYFEAEKVTDRKQWVEALCEAMPTKIFQIPLKFATMRSESLERKALQGSLPLSLRNPLPAPLFDAFQYLQQYAMHEDVWIQQPAKEKENRVLQLAQAYDLGSMGIEFLQGMQRKNDEESPIKFCFILCDMVKYYIECLPQPLVEQSFLNSWLHLIRQKERLTEGGPQTFVSQLRILLNRLHPCNQYVLQSLASHLREVANSDQNKLSVDDLVAVFPRLKDFLAELIDSYEEIFPAPGKERR